MKKENIQQLKGLTLVSLWVVILAFTSCGGGQKSEAEKKLEETRVQTTQSINKMKIDLEERISYINKELETAVGEVSDKLKEAREELEAQRDLLVAELENIKTATLDTWNDAVKKASETMAKASEKRNEVSKNVREMLDAK